MISLGMADLVILTSLSIYIGVYFFVCRREGSYVNLLTPTTLLSIPAFYLFPCCTYTCFNRKVRPSRTSTFTQRSRWKVSSSHPSSVAALRP